MKRPTPTEAPPTGPDEHPSPQNSGTKALSPKIAEKLAVVPEAPGIYKMFDTRGTIIYVGKAKVLRSRVRSYFHAHLEREITRLLVSRIADLDWIVVGSEKEALILENNLIKEHQPHFNISLKDNKTYPYIKITTDEPWPRAIKTRELTKRGQFFGPYTDLPLMYTFLDVLREVYPLKKCGQRQFPKGFKPCLYFHIGRCLPYCTGQVSEETQQSLLKEIGDFLKGHTDTAIAMLKRRMEAESARQEYERALVIRDQIKALERIEERQQVVLTSRNAFEVVWPYRSEGVILFSVLSFRDGKLLDKHIFPFASGLLDGLEDEAEQEALVREELEHFLVQYFGEHPYPVEEILLPFPPERLPTSPSALEAHLAEVIRKKFLGEIPEGWVGPRLSQPLRGDKVRLLTLAESNARLSFFELQREKEKSGGAAHLRDVLGLKKIPRRVESFDIANTGERAIIAGMVHFADGRPDKSHYRIFNIRSVNGPDDYASMREAVTRRYRRLLAENIPLPDLILIDGGKGQLSSAREALISLGLKDQPVISLAKQIEEIFLPGREESVQLPHDDPGLQFLVMVRNETHRWVNGRHRARRDKEALESRLLSVPGIGAAKIKALFDHFDSLEDFLAASPESQKSVSLLSAADRASIQKAFTKAPVKKYKLKSTFGNPKTWEGR